MKKILSVIASVALFAGLWSCKPDEKPVVPGIDLTGEATIQVPAADVPTVTISFSATVAWTAEASDEWVTIAPKKGDAGEASIKVNVDDNTLAESRSLKVTITAGEAVKEVTITQEGAFVPHFDVDPSSCQFSGFGDGEPFSIEKEAGEHTIPVSTNLDWDAYLAIWDSELGYAVETDHNDWLVVSKTSEGIKITVTENTTYDARVEYIYVACHVGDDYENYSGYGACILVSQIGLDAPTVPTLVWTKKFADISENVAISEYMRLAYSEGEIMLSDGSAVYGLDPASGDLWDTFDVKAQSFDSDDEGNLILMDDTATGDGAINFYWTPSINDKPALLYSFTNLDGYWGNCGNVRVRGDIANGKSVVTATIGSMRFYLAFAFDKGEYYNPTTLEPIRSSLNATGDGWNPDNIAAISVAPDDPTKGIIYRGYVTGQPDGDQLTYLRVDPSVPHWSSPEWALVTELGSGGNECQNNIDILDIEGRRIMAFTQGGWFSWIGNANIYVLDITDLTNVSVIANIPTEDWIDMENPQAVRGADVLLRANGNTVELYAVRANGASVAKFIFGLE